MSSLIQISDIDISFVTSIGKGSFRNCTSLTDEKLNAPNLESIDIGAFNGCAMITTINFPKLTSLTSDVGNPTFANCPLLSTIELPMVSDIGKCAFYNCTGLTTINLPLITVVPERAFYNCKELPIINIDNVTSINDYAFRYCEKLSSINLSNVETIGAGAFYSCKSLTNVVLNSATIVGNEAFYLCNSLTKIDLPVVQSLGSSVFYHCKKLTAVIIRQPGVILQGANTFKDTLIESGTGYIYVPSEYLQQYKKDTNWSIYSEQFRAIEDYPEITGGI